MGVEIDVCPACRGVWFDAGEMPDYLKRVLEADAEIPHMGIDLDEKAVAVNQLTESTRACPRCNAEMHKHNYAYDSNVILDACSACQGHWADGGEVLRLAVYTKGNPKLDRMAESMAAHVEDHQRFKQMASDVAGLGSSAYPAVMIPLKIVLPLYDDIPTAITPWVTLAFMTLNVFITALAFMGGDAMAQSITQFALVPEQILSGNGGHYALVSHMFLHAGIIHLLGNMLFLWIFGDNIEEEFGHASFFGFYILSGVIAGLTHMYFTAIPEAPLVGASGAVAGVMGAYFMFHPRARIKTFIFVGVFDVPAIFYLLGWFVLQLIPAVLEWGGAISSSVAYAAHAAGFITGVSLAGLRKLVVRSSNSYSPT